MPINDKTYDALKWITTLVLPAIGTLYFALASIWNFPYGEQVIGTITAVVTFFGVILKLSNYKYEGDGIIAIDHSDKGNDTYALAFSAPLNEISGKKTINLKVTETTNDGDE